MAARKKATSARGKGAKKPAAKKKTTAKKKTAKAPAAKKKTAGAPAAKKKTAKAPAAKKSTPAKKKTASKKKTTATKKKTTSAASRAKPAKKKTAAAPAARKATRKKAGSAKKKKKKAAAPEPAVEETAPLEPGRAVIAFSGSDVRNKLGEKWTCFECGTAFYDLGRDSKVCPKCGMNQADKPKPGASPPSAPRSTRRASRPMAPLLEEDDDAVRYNEEFDLGIQENGGDEEESPGTGDQDLFPDTDAPDEPEEADDD